MPAFTEQRRRLLCRLPPPLFPLCCRSHLCLPAIPAHASGHQDEGSAVFISNLQWWTTDAELEQACAAYGCVVSIRFIDDKVGALACLLACLFACLLVFFGLKSACLQSLHSTVQHPLVRPVHSMPSCALSLLARPPALPQACGKSRGMAIVEFAEAEAATQCISGLNGCALWKASGRQASAGAQLAGCS